MAFLGNRDVTITAIDVGGGIVCSRTSDGDTDGVPFFVQVSASAITATGTSVPYEDLDFRWDFGDPSGTEWFTRPTDGKRVNANNGQRGPEGAYVYRIAGTYTITLRVYGKNGSSIVSASTTMQVTAVAYDSTGGTRYFDPGAATDGDGTQSTTPFNSVASVNTFLSSGGNKRLRIACGSQLSGSTAIQGIANPLRVDSYGSGARPIIEQTGTLQCWRTTSGGSSSPSPKSNIVISGVEFRHSGGTGGANVEFTCSGNTDVTSILKNVYFDNCKFNTLSDRNNFQVNLEYLANGQTPVNYGLWNCDFVSPLATPAQCKGALNNSSRRWFFAVGGSYVGAGSHDVLAHHIYPSTQEHSLYEWINFGSGPKRNYCVDTNYNTSSGALEIAQYISISENYMSGTHRCWDGGQSLDVVSTPQLTDWRNYVAQSNCVVGMDGDLLTGLDACSSHTCRDNLFWNCTSRGIGPANQGSNTGTGDNAGWMATNFSGKFYRNYFYWPYQPVNASMYPIIDYAKTGGYAYAKPQLIVDNVLIDMRATAATINITFADFVSNGSLIDRNTHWTPGDVNGTVTTDGVNAKNWAQWRASNFDAHGANSDPGAPDAANGRFTSGKRTMAISF